MSNNIMMFLNAKESVVVLRERLYSSQATLLTIAERLSASKDPKSLASELDEEILRLIEIKRILDGIPKSEG